MADAYEYFGKYILLEKLATGGMAEVFLARAPGADGIGKFVAIKRILPQFAESPEFIDMFRDEAKIAINLSHSNIVSIQEFGIQANQFYIVMDFVEGKNLRQILNKLKKVGQTFTFEQIVFICKEVSGGLDHAHRCLDGTTGKPLNITHRDMSPQNVMTSYEGEVKIVDFGIAKAESQMETTRAGTLKGKFGYMSPEQAEGQTVDLRTDIFSLGIVLWELLANDRLFMANNEINTLRKIRDCQIPSLRKINPNIDAELERIVMKALTRDRSMRYQTGAALHRDLNRFLNRKYPDFSPHDFSVSIKTLFADEILSNRKKFIEYARVPFRQEPQTRTVLTRTFETNADLDKNTIATGDYSNPTFERSDYHNDDKAAAPQQVQQSARDAYQQNQTVPQIVKPPPKFKPKMVDDDDIEELSLTRRNNGAWVLRAMMMSLFVFVCYSYFAKYYTASMKGVIRFTNPVLAPLHAALGVDGNQSLSSTAPVQQQRTVPPVAATPPPPQAAIEPVHEWMTSIIVTSNPSGAEIYIKGKNTGLLTPSRVELPQERVFALGLKKTGYADILRKDVDRSNLSSRLSFELPKAVVGYLEIDVRPPRFVRLFVNGQPVSFDHMPISKFPVAADTPVVIRAEDPETRTFVEKTTSVSLEKYSRVLLDFRTAKPLGRLRRTSSQN